MDHYELGQHTATLDGQTHHLALSGTSGSIVLSAREAYQLLDLLYAERTRLYRCANGEPPEPELPAWIKVGGERQIQQKKQITDFRIMPVVVFRCPECGDLRQIERSLPDIISTGVSCHCVASYRVIWGETEETTRVEIVE